MKNYRKIAITISIFCALVAVMLISMTGFAVACDEMQKNIIRIRIIANSDSEYDQQIKIALRDEILDSSVDIFAGADCYDEALTAVKQGREELLSVAEGFLAKNHIDYGVKIELRQEFFETRIYDDFTLPAGYYNTAVFTLGEGKGENWWCVLYPEVCVGSCAQRLESTVSDRSAGIAYAGNKYVVKFKTVEIYEKIKKCFNLSK